MMSFLLRQTAEGTPLQERPVSLDNDLDIYRVLCQNSALLK